VFNYRLGLCQMLLYECIRGGLYVRKIHFSSDEHNHERCFEVYTQD